MTLHTAHALVKLFEWGFGIGQTLAARGVRLTCADCGREVTPATGKRFDHCCGRIVCNACFDAYVTPSGRGSVVLACRCGDRRVLSQ